MHRVKGDRIRCEELLAGDSFAAHQGAVDVDVLKSEFRYVSINIDQAEVLSFRTLVVKLHKCNLGHLRLVTKNFMALVKIKSRMMPTSISAERSFSVLRRVKTKLRNSMGDERMFHLAMLKFYPSMEETIHIVALCNKFVPQTQHASRRESLFGKFVQEDLTIESIEPKKKSVIEIASNFGDNIMSEFDSTALSPLKKSAVDWKMC